MIQGFGLLIADRKEIGRVEYKIDVSVGAAGMKSARGFVFGSAQQLAAAYNAERLVLVREDCGFEVKMVVDGMEASGQGASITVSGSPGPLD